MVLDGNAIGGLLQEVFGTDMTDAEATCATCGATGPVAETAVYLRGPGTVVRCRKVFRNTVRNTILPSAVHQHVILAAASRSRIRSSQTAPCR